MWEAQPVVRREVIFHGPTEAFVTELLASYATLSMGLVHATQHGKLSPGVCR